jgi:geranylgeranyl reductase family protein
MFWDVIVAGAGPAGASAAAVLGDAGLRVLLLDRRCFPREKVCGDGLTTDCFAPLRRLGLFEALKALARPCTSTYFSFSNGTELVLQGTKTNPLAFVLSRYDFDQLLFERAITHRHVVFMGDCTVQSLLHESGRIAGVMVASGDRLEAHRAPLVIDCTGANSRIAAEVSPESRRPLRCALALRGYYEDVAEIGDALEFYFVRGALPGYFWIFPTSPTSANIGFGSFSSVGDGARIDLRATMQHLIANGPFARKLEKARPGQLKGGRVPLALDRASSRVRDGLILAGDAAAFADSISAEGISQAMQSGICAGEIGAIALASGDTSAQSLGRYDEFWRASFGREFTPCDYHDENGAEYERVFKLRALVAASLWKQSDAA